MAPAELAVLPEDILVEVLRRQAPHDLAASRWVCRAWRDAIDDRLRGQLLSRSVRGIFINYTKHTMSEFLSRPSAGPAIRGGLDCLPCKGAKVTDHCNGLLLCRDWNDPEQEYVVNPATRRWARLPRRPPPHTPGLIYRTAAYLAFDHAVSPHYEVYLIPRVPQHGEVNSDDSTLLLRTDEWPPVSHVMHVLSSMTGRWEKKTFVRDGPGAGVVDDMASCRSWADQHRAVYWRGALYVHSQCDFVLRLCSSSSKYQVIKMPGHSGLFPCSTHLGRSMRGVYYAISHSYSALQLWYLDESSACGQMKWVLKHDIDLQSFARKFHLLRRRDYGHQPMEDKRWILQDVNYRKCPCFLYDRIENGDYEAPAEDKYEWNSDDDNILDGEHVVQEARWSGTIRFLGFHPYKEMVFLAVSLEETVAYDWNASRFQFLGRTSPKHYEELAMQHQDMDTGFPYTPCWMYEFPRRESSCKQNWVPPVGLELKINTDASFYADELQGGTGVVVRDAKGALIRAQALWYEHAPSATVMEAYAIRDGTILAMEHGYRNVCVETDAQVLANLRETDDDGRSEVAVILQEVRELSRMFSSFCITYVSRDANEAAHLCAKRASAARRRCLWMNFIPDFLAPTLQRDCNLAV